MEGEEGSALSTCAQEKSQEWAQEQRGMEGEEGRSRDNRRERKADTQEEGRHERERKKRPTHAEGEIA